jgi:hypothetical protein
MPTTIRARLAKNGNDAEDAPRYRVLCGRLREGDTYGCGAELGVLGVSSDDSLDPRFHLFSFASGWVEGPDAIWTLAKSAQRKKQWGGTFPTRRPVYTGRAQDNPTAVHDPLLGPPQESQKQYYLPVRSTTLPCQVRCAKCSGINLVEETLVTEARERFLQESAQRGVPWALEVLTARDRGQ